MPYAHYIIEYRDGTFQKYIIFTYDEILTYGTVEVIQPTVDATTKWLNGVVNSLTLPSEVKVEIALHE